MAAVATPLAPMSNPHSSETILLSPPKVRQPYTPPPQKDEEDTSVDTRPLSRHSDDMNGHVDVDMKSLHLNSIEDCAGQKRKKKHHRSKNGGESLAGMLRRGIVEHQLGLSLNAILLVGMSWCMFPSLRRDLEASFTLSYKIQRREAGGESLYGQGPRDLWLVASLVVIFTGVRAFMLDHVLVPLAAILGIRKRKRRVRYVNCSCEKIVFRQTGTNGVQIRRAKLPSPLLHDLLDVGRSNLHSGYAIKLLELCSDHRIRHHECSDIALDPLPEAVCWSRDEVLLPLSTRFLGPANRSHTSGRATA